MRRERSLGLVNSTCSTSTMSLLARAALHARPRPASTLLLQNRAVSTAAHEHHHDDHHHTDNTQYAKEGRYSQYYRCSNCSFLHYLDSISDGFFTPFWRNTFLFSAVIVAFYKFAPARGEDNYVTQYLARFQTPSEVWAALNEKHVNAVTVQSDQLLLQNSATRPTVHRYRYPQ